MNVTPKKRGPVPGPLPNIWGKKSYELPVGIGEGGADPVGGGLVSQFGTWQHLLLGSVVSVQCDGSGGERGHL